MLGTGMLSWAATMFCWDARSDLCFLLSDVDPESFSPDPDPTFQQHVLALLDPDPLVRGMDQLGRHNVLLGCQVRHCLKLPAQCCGPGII